ncbi:hypothetical protein C1646_761456 [Rhizophagus diaphanus]|nr:hypothetical protein C1646_761456 [Rhizophagus diaphanus] [Rhizophagus sp. MUCL 43196]
MVKKYRSDEKDTTCKCCGKVYVNLNKLHEHLRRKNPCKPLSEITASIHVPIQETSCRPENFDRKHFYLEMKKEGNRPYTGMIKSKWSSFLNSAFNYLQRDFDRRRGGYIDKKGVVAEICKEIFPERLPEVTGNTDTPVQTPEPELQITAQDPASKPELIHGRKYITEEEAKAWPIEVNDLDGCKMLFYDLEQYDPEAVRLPTLKELKKYEKILEFEGGSGPKTQSFREGNNLINKEFECLGEIKGPERSEKDLEFREQEELGTAVKRRAIAIHRAKVPKSHPDNGSDIQKILESRRKQFKEILKKEFDKREQFKFALCSLTKFLIDDKPGNKKQGKKNLRTDWLRNRQIIVYNRNKIDDYLSNAFEQILYQVEERGESIVKTSGDQLQSVALLLPPSNSLGSNRCRTSV